MTPLVSLITPTYRAAAFLGEFLDSVLAQSYDHLEFILVNDGSDDDSEQIILSRAPALRGKCAAFHYLRQEHQGQAAAFNRALPLVSGDYLAWADSDDILHPDNIRLKAEYLRLHPACRMVRHNAVEFEEESGAVLRQTAGNEDKATQNIFEPLFLSRTYVLAGCYMLETALFRECYPNMRIPDSPVGQNLQMLLPPASRAECHYIDAVLLRYRRHRGGHHLQHLAAGKTLSRARELSILLTRLVEYCRCDKERFQVLAAGQERQIAAQLRAGLKRRKT